MGITRVKEDLLKDLKIDNNIDIGAMTDQNIVHQGSYDLPYGGEERIEWKVTLEPKTSANISIKRKGQEVSEFELNEENLSKASSMGSRYYKRSITLSLNLEGQHLLLNGKVCATSHPEDSRGWHCMEYHDESLFSW
jgi:hypothetical protein